MSLKYSLSFLALSFLLLQAAPARADVKLPSIESDYMLLQAGSGTRFFGTAAPGEAVTISYGGRKSNAVADKDGRWGTVLRPLKSGERFDMEVVGKNTITIKNVLVGEVWLCSGQSNMEWPLGKSQNHATEVPAANHEQIRLFTVKRKLSTTPQTDVSGSWCICNPTTAAPFSAVGYFFGRQLQKDLKTPVGLISSSWGGTPAQVWASLDGLESDSVTQKRYWIMAPEQLAHVHNMNVNFEKSLADAEKAGTAKPPRPPELEFPHAPSMLFNGMISGLIPYTLAGVLWYQGESNAYGADETMAYRRLFPVLIRDWRKHFQSPDLPFLFVQLANYEKKEEPNERSPWAELRESQTMTLSLPHTGMAVTIDIGDDKDIHPKNKLDVGKRLERVALAKVYGKKISYSGPMFAGMSVKNGRAICAFNFADGLKTRDGKRPRGFIIAGADGKFVNADGVIKDHAVIVSSKSVPAPTAVRYAWQGAPSEANLCNGIGLPASPFRSDVPVEPPVVNLPVTK